ncbi:hypothetical protein FRACYDRAFT_251150 [Fragilariopsis cylindrus CCMP1102]|uniref:Uncharacterized protein n=1 Tax=Fragilariopsis cylindrus CCMP1102 TaxID=635003 RepID=A0A1E7EN64_9STRA|nr:hypothetical protein FRACYDRAFT_251150 [Fragilariopsis cylindrus CCMP1102]|eukprot:OEU07345.1 hypothetical protein FRACYDRAFT_251150 [Fragilariopsis cylindrus CCMP1102]
MVNTSFRGLDRDDKKNSNSIKIDRWKDTGAVPSNSIIQQQQQRRQRLVIDEKDANENFINVKDRLRDFKSTAIESRQDDDDGEEEDDNDDERTYTGIKDRVREIQSTKAMRDISSIASISSKCSSPLFSSNVSSHVVTNNEIFRNKWQQQQRLKNMEGLPRSKNAGTVITPPLNNNNNNNNNNGIQIPPFVVSIIDEPDGAFFSPTSTMDGGGIPTMNVQENKKDDRIDDMSSPKNGYRYGDVSLKRVENPIEDRWKKPNKSIKPQIRSISDCGAASYSRLSLSSIITNSSRNDDELTTTTMNDSKPVGAASNIGVSSALSLSSIITNSNKTNNDNETNIWSNQRRISLPAPNLGLVKQKSEKNNIPITKPRPLTHRSFSTPEFAGTTSKQVEQVKEGGTRTDAVGATWLSSSSYKSKQTASLLPPSSPTVRSNKQSDDESKYQNDFAAALNKVGPPIEEKWKLVKSCDEKMIPNFETGPIFANKKSKNTLKVVTSVRDLAKSFSTNALLSPKNEPNQGDNNSTERPSTETSEIGKIRNSLRSAAKELEWIRNSLNSPVSKMIEERNNGQTGHSEEMTFEKKNRSSEKELEMIRSLGLARAISLSHIERSVAVDGYSSVNNPLSPYTQGQFCDPVTKKNKQAFESDRSDDIPNQLARLRCWGNSKTKNFQEQSQDNSVASSSYRHSGRRYMHHDHLSFSEQEVAISSSQSSNYKSDMPSYVEGRSTSSLSSKYTADDTSELIHDELFSASSMLSDYTTDTEGDFAIYGDNRYIQITLSSGGIAEKSEPNIAMSPTLESSDSEGMSMISSVDSLSDERQYDSRNDKRKSRKALKGAKNFFFGQIKKKSMAVI